MNGIFSGSQSRPILVWQLVFPIVMADGAVGADVMPLAEGGHNIDQGLVYVQPMVQPLIAPYAEVHVQVHSNVILIPVLVPGLLLEPDRRQDMVMCHHVLSPLGFARWDRGVRPLRTNLSLSFYINVDNA
jgi:hypothetical protein